LPLGVEISLGPYDVVLDEVKPPPTERDAAASPLSRFMGAG